MSISEKFTKFYTHEYKFGNLLKYIFSYSFVMEYCGEVCSLEEFELRRNQYEKDSRRHYYFMSLKTDEVPPKCTLNCFITHPCR